MAAVLGLVLSCRPVKKDEDTTPPTLVLEAPTGDNWTYEAEQPVRLVWKMTDDWRVARRFFTIRMLTGNPQGAWQVQDTAYGFGTSARDTITLQIPGTVSPGTYELRGWALDAVQLESAPVVRTFTITNPRYVDPSGPSVNLTLPSDNEVVSAGGPLRLKFTAQATDGLYAVEWSVRNTANQAFVPDAFRSFPAGVTTYALDTLLPVPTGALVGTYTLNLRVTNRAFDTRTVTRSVRAQ